MGSGQKPPPFLDNRKPAPQASMASMPRVPFSATGEPPKPAAKSASKKRRAEGPVEELDKIPEEPPTPVKTPGTSTTKKRRTLDGEDEPPTPVKTPATFTQERHSLSSGEDIPLEAFNKKSRTFFPNGNDGPEEPPAAAPSGKKRRTGSSPTFDSSCNLYWPGKKNYDASQPNMFGTYGVPTPGTGTAPALSNFGSGPSPAPAPSAGTFNFGASATPAPAPAAGAFEFGSGPGPAPFDFGGPFEFGGNKDDDEDDTPGKENVKPIWSGNISIRKDKK